MHSSKGTWKLEFESRSKDKRAAPGSGRGARVHPGSDMAERRKEEKLWSVVCSQRKLVEESHFSHTMGGLDVFGGQILILP